LRDAAAEEALTPAGAIEGVDEVTYQIVGVARPAVGELVLGKVPDALVGIKLGGVGGKRDKAEPAVAATESLDRISAVDRGLVPKDEDFAAQVPQQLAHERTDLGVANGGGECCWCGGRSRGRGGVAWG
jgi:hypothetical protein